MANDSYLKLTGETQGAVEGSCDIEGQEGKMDVYGWSHEVVAPRDPKSGLPTGQRQHKPFTITKPVDKATPLLMAILVRNENITEWNIECWRPSAVGAPEQFFSVDLKNANIAGIRQEQLNTKYAENAAHELREHISFTYQKIIWTWQVGGAIEAEDDWKSKQT